MSICTLLATWWGQGHRETWPCHQGAVSSGRHIHRYLTRAMCVVKGQVKLRYRNLVPVCLASEVCGDLSIGEGRRNMTKSGGWEGAGLERRLESEWQERGGPWGESQQPPPPPPRHEADTEELGNQGQFLTLRSPGCPLPRLIVWIVQTGNTAGSPTHTVANSSEVCAICCVLFLFQNYPTLQKILSQNSLITISANNKQNDAFRWWNLMCSSQTPWSPCNNVQLIGNCTPMTPSIKTSRRCHKNALLYLQACSPQQLFRNLRNFLTLFLMTVHCPGLDNSSCCNVLIDSCRTAGLQWIGTLGSCAQSKCFIMKKSLESFYHTIG